MALKAVDIFDRNITTTAILTDLSLGATLLPEELPIKEGFLFKAKLSKLSNRRVGGG
jgi:hypothetical protein